MITQLLKAPPAEEILSEPPVSLIELMDVGDPHNNG